MACCYAMSQEVRRLTSKLDKWENHVCRPITPDPKRCSACPDKQRELDIQQSRLRQLESDHASELRKQEGQVRDLQAQLQSFSGLQQVHANPVHLRRMFIRCSLTCSIEGQQGLTASEVPCGRCISCCHPECRPGSCAEKGVAADTRVCGACAPGHIELQ